MKKNIHPLERKMRIVFGLILVAMAFVGPANKWFLLGLIPVATGLMGWCPPYAMLGISTCKMGNKSGNEDKGGCCNHNH